MKPRFASLLRPSVSTFYEPFGFWSGFASTLDVGGTSYSLRPYWDPFPGHEDARALYHDWCAVGRDLVKGARSRE